ncbi:hypothetical protein HY449_03270 [Candidatus Pacearchaeota archaeon]|nr:hypothetical protein [Candidatus Pacearchaeota archaeon]
MKIFNFAWIFLFVIIFAGFASADYFLSSPQITMPGSAFNYGGNLPLGPAFNSNSCGAGQDFIIQVAPFGCSPSVVRSDLLEEQNVPVFCQLMATKLNPLINVQSIDSISFTGNYPNEVAGIGFNPARAALSSAGQTFLNSPVTNNIGYAVIVLKQQQNESSMPEFVSGNLTANIRYNIQNAFGVGAANYFVPELTEEEWAQRYAQYGFMNGRGFVKADNVNADSATISLYLDKTNRLSTFNLRKGETSGDAYLPGFYCAASLNVRLEGVENPNTRARIEINGEIIQAGVGERFLNNACVVSSPPQKRGMSESVDISCRTDSGNERINLIIAPRIKLNVDNTEKAFGVGDYIGEAADKKSIYLGYIGTKGDSRDKKDLFVYFISMPQRKDKLSNDEISRTNTIVNLIRYNKITTIGVIDVPLNAFKNFAGASNLVYEFFKGNEFVYLTSSENEFSFGGKKIKLVDFVDGQDINFPDAQTSENYKKAMSDYREIINKYPGEKEPNSQEAFGKLALIEAIKLASSVEQKKTLRELCDEFSQKYPDAKAEAVNHCDSVRISSSESATRKLLINGNVKEISFDGIYQPSLEEYSAEVKVTYPDGRTSDIFTLTKDQTIILNETKNEYVQLVSLSDNYATIQINLVPTTISEAYTAPFIASVKNINKGIQETFGSGYTFTLTQINLKKVAKVSIIPNIKNSGTTGNFSFTVGIEKRAIQLTPDQIRERIQSLNESISEWQGTSEKVGQVVKGFNAACLAVGTAITVKNLFQGFDGKAIARQEVMRSPGGWIDSCTQKVNEKQFSTVDSCLLKYSDDIEKDVGIVEGIIKNQKPITNENANIRLAEIRNSLGDKIENPNKKGEFIELSENSDAGEAFTNEGIKNGRITLSQARDLERLNSELNSAASQQDKELAQRKIYSILSQIKANSEQLSLYNSIQSELNKANIGEIGVVAYGGKNAIEGSYTGGIIKGDKIIGAGISDGKDYPAQVVVYNNKKYLLTLQGAGSSYAINKVYQYDGADSNRIYIKPVEPGEENTIRGAFSKFTRYDLGSYQNNFINPRVRYFETEPYKGLPAIVPFDTKAGWYVATKQIVGGLAGSVSGQGGIRAYDDSGRLTSFYLCNVGQNGREEFNSNLGDDVCRSFNPGVSQLQGTFQGLSESDTNRIMSRAVQAVQEASTQYKPSLSASGTVKVLNEFIPVGEPSINTPDIQCQDFMSPKECNILFNVCDPVVCPASRCNLGGAYNVPDVIQSGIIGSVALCLPNARENIAVPICLSGVKAGIDSFVSVEKNYRDCLQTNLDTGKTVGICDQIHSVYLCDFFWSQAQPMAKVIVPKIFEKILGQTGRGGGEYLGVASAWENAGRSIDYMTQYYGAASFEAFRTGIIKEVGNAVCRNFVSAAYPSNMKFFDSLIEPQSPPQYTAWFSEQAYATSTNPPTSRYKVFYHIYAGENTGQAGKNAGAFYSVYLKSPSGSSFYQYSPTLNVASGFISPADYASETKDFTAPSGYKELCINVNGQENCGFNQVSTDFGLKYLQDSYAQSQINQTSIQSEKDCVSGTPFNLYSLANPNIQEGATQFVDPAIYNQQIVRVCSTENPGKGTDPHSGTENSRWIPVGNCEPTGKLKCYLDTKSIGSAIQGAGLRNETLQELSRYYSTQLQNQTQFDFNSELEKIIKLDNSGKISHITPSLISKAILNFQKAKFLLLRGNAYGEIAKGLFEKLKLTTTPSGTTAAEGVICTPAPGITTTTPSTSGTGIFNIQNIAYEYPVLTLNNPGFFGGKDYYFKYSNQNKNWDWYWSNDNSQWTVVDSDNLPERGSTLRGLDVDLIVNLRGVSYDDGVVNIISTAKSLQNDLSTENVKFSNSDNLFTVSQKESGLPSSIYLKYENSKWFWTYSSTQNDLIDLSDFTNSKLSVVTNYNKQIFASIAGKSYEEGVKMIFSIDVKEKIISTTSESLPSNSELSKIPDSGVICTPVPGTTTTTPSTSGTGTFNIQNIAYEYPILTLNNPGFFGGLTQKTYYFKYSNQNNNWAWYWSNDNSQWTSVDSSNLPTRASNLRGLDTDLITNLRGVSYEDGVAQIISTANSLQNDLSTENVKFSYSDNLFTINQKEGGLPNSIYLKYENSKWFWTYSSTQNDWIDLSDFANSKLSVVTNYNKQIFASIAGKNFRDGVKIIFSIDVKQKIVGASGASGSQKLSNLNLGTCTTRQECQKAIGNGIIKIARDVKNAANIPDIDSTIKAEGVAENFECLVLQIAMQESSLQHCQNIQQNLDPVYCDGAKDKVKTLSTANENSFGVMQINTNVHAVPAQYFEEGVYYASYNIFIKSYLAYGQEGMAFRPTGTTYSGWKAAIRSYNGWGYGGDNNYVEKITTDRKLEIQQMFSDVCGGSNVAPIKTFPQVPAPWSVQSALDSIQTKTGKYSNNKEFIDQLYQDGILTQPEYIEISGDGFFNLEEDMNYVKNILQNKLVEQRKGT